MSLSVTLFCREPYRPAVQDLSFFLWGLSLVHDRIMLYWEDPTNSILYSPNFYSNWRRLPSGLELKFGDVSRQSPLTIELIVATAGGILLAAKTFAEILHIIRDWSVDKDRKELENILTRLEIYEKIEGLRRASPELMLLLDRDIHKILSSEIKIVEVREEQIPDE